MSPHIQCVNTRFLVKVFALDCHPLNICFYELSIRDFRNWKICVLNTIKKIVSFKNAPYEHSCERGCTKFDTVEIQICRNATTSNISLLK